MPQNTAQPRPQGGDGLNLDEKRSYPRFPAWLDGRVRDPHARTTAAAIIMDLSKGGALLASVAVMEPNSLVEVQLARRMRPLPARVLSVEDSWQGTLLHVRFEGLSEEDEANLTQVLDELEGGFQDFQHFLAGVSPHHA